MEPVTVPSRDHLRKFQFIREIASGGFGSVFLTKVMHADGFSRLVAVKLLKSQWSDSDEVARRMRDEARLLGLLRHRNIVDVIDLTSIDGRAAVIMEYLEAVDFRTVVESLATQGARLPVRAALEAIASVASALDAAYNRPPIPGDKPLRVIHRDIKPSNIMVDDTGMVKVLDFGVARSEIDNRESHTQELQFGSVDYMAPERLFFEPETPASDVYSLAATLFEILALEKFGKARGRPARHSAYVVDRLSFLRAGIEGVPGNVATELEKLIGQGLEFNHEDRPTAAEFYQRARALARKVDSEDLGGWAEQAIPAMVAASQADGPTGNLLAGSTLSEDSRAFAPGEHHPESQSAGAADVLRQGALAEMEDTGAFVPSPQTGAPAQLHGRAPYAPDPESEWDDGPTAVGALKGPVRVARPDNAHDARLVQTGTPRPTSPSPADPADPFAQLVRSPLSPPKTPKPRPKTAPVDDGDTLVAEALQGPAVPVQRPSTGHYDPDAPEAHAPIPPLPAPPGVVARALEPALPADDSAAPSAGHVDSKAEILPSAVPVGERSGPQSSQKASSAREAVSVVGPPAAVFDAADATNINQVGTQNTTAQLAPVGAGAANRSSTPAASSAGGPSAAPTSGGVTVRPPPSPVFDASDSTNILPSQGGSEVGQLATDGEAVEPELLATEVVAPEPSAPPVVPRADHSNAKAAPSQSQSEERSFVAPPSAVFDDQDATNVMYVQSDAVQTKRLTSSGGGAPMAPAVTGPERNPPTPSESPATSAVDGVPEPPSLDDVVPQSKESRYGPDLERMRVESESLSADSLAVVPSYEPTLDGLSADDDVHARSTTLPVVPPPSSSIADRAPAPASVVQAPMASDAEDDEDAPPQKSKMPVLAAVGCLGFALIGGGGLSAAFALGFIGGGATETSVAANVTEEAVAETADEVSTEAPPEEEAVPEGMSQIRSGADDTKKVSVSCEGGVKKDGATSVLLPGDVAGPCRVKVILNSRKRLTATIEAPAPGVVVCFADGADECAPQ